VPLRWFRSCHFMRGACTANDTHYLSCRFFFDERPRANIYSALLHSSPLFIAILIIDLTAAIWPTCRKSAANDWTKRRLCTRVSGKWWSCSKHHTSSVDTHVFHPRIAVYSSTSRWQDHNPHYLLHEAAFPRIIFMFILIADSTEVSLS